MWYTCIHRHWNDIESGSGQIIISWLFRDSKTQIIGHIYWFGEWCYNKQILFSNSLPSLPEFKMKIENKKDQYNTMVVSLLLLK